MSEQVGMGAGTVEYKSTSRRLNFVDERPIALNMTVKRPFLFAMRRVVTAFGMWLLAYSVHSPSKSRPSSTGAGIKVIIAFPVGTSWGTSMVKRRLAGISTFCVTLIRKI